MPTIMIATIPLAASVVGIAALLGLKHIELRRGRTFFPNARARLDERVLRMTRVVRESVPRALRHVATDVAHYVAEKISALVLRIVRFVERRLTRFVDMVRGRRKIKAGNGTNSSYLRDVTSHRDEVRRINGYHPKK